MKLYNTLSKKIEEVKTSSGKVVTMYNCGPTVYLRPHIGNLRAYIGWDILHRFLVYTGHTVKRVVNLTDVGHMVGDIDEGEDKVENTAKKEGKSPIEIADEYTRTVLSDFSRINILSPNGERIDPNVDLHKLKSFGWTRATEYIDEMISLIKRMENRGYTYETEQAIYFDVTKYPEYSKLSGQKIEDKKVGAREDVRIDSSKKNPADFVLWMKRVGKYENHAMHWNSPWGDGFPGWHIECSAMGISVLGEEISIHTGGIDHIAVHHSNEIAQNFGSTGKEVVKMWVHNEFLVSKEGDKLSKDKGNSINLDQVILLGYDPMDLRYLLGSVNYRIPLRFSKKALLGARNARMRIINRLTEIKDKSRDRNGEILLDYKSKFIDALNNNLNVSEAYAILAGLLKSDEEPENILATVYDFDKVFGLNLKESVDMVISKIPDRVEELLERRKRARASGDYNLSDDMRDEIEKLGYSVLDTPNGQEVKKKDAAN